MSDAEYIVTLQGIIERERTAALKLADMVKIAHAAGYAAGLERAAQVCEELAVLERTRASQEMDADSCSRALSREAAAKRLVATIRALAALAAQPPASAPAAT